jgi:4-diphosphocytidyl-2-C-methyl-D-erythritol kinase
MIEAFAPAKVNLTLHVTGQRDDGYHLLDSLVVFTDCGDRLVIEEANELSLTVTGPYAKNLGDDPDNLILRAARMLSGTKGARITLEKNLPIASGVGGGSSDAAATLRALSAFWSEPLPDAPEALGADVPVCLRGFPTRMTGIGETLSDVPMLPPCWLVLVNPGVQVPTPKVFAALKDKQNRAMPVDLPDFGSTHDFAAWLNWMRNDLETPAMQVQPVVATVLAALKTQKGCLFARMSGAGATCWGLFDDPEIAQRAADTITEQRPNWWCQATEITPI